MKPLDRPEISLTVCKLSTPVTKSVVVLAKPDAEELEQVVIKIYDPRYLDDRLPRIPSLPSHPWDLTNERAAAMARSQNSTLSYEELVGKIYSAEPDDDSDEPDGVSDEPEDVSGEGPDTHDFLMLLEKKYYRLMMDCYNTELTAYERLRDLQGSVIPSLIMAGQFLPPGERAIRPPALVLEYIPSVSLLEVPFDAITPTIRAQLLSDIESFPSYGVVHNNITLTNIRFTPPE